MKETSIMKRLSVLAAGLLFSVAVLAGAADNVSVQDPYVRLAPPNAPATGAFMVIKNNGDKDVKVVKADNPMSKATELHTHLNEGGVMKMRPVAAIEIKAKGEAVLKPGGLHVMLIDLKAAMQEGDSVPITLTFDDGSSKQVDAKVVRPVPAPAPVQQKQH
ncbi:MAG: copper chaperone PCu(A)C [Dechloromonas sp.]|uniref:Copper chaperone PCu(A)C n=1 Tax=Candidatus Dechloromonas phosphorivorans TaxID=2899244 RepID=A0A9D7LP51_9RHOO|nr:copper chaperone PCu(A)C [Candidatus Dechloromonas phosphorivorans]